VNDEKAKLKGSWSRDEFKHEHKRWGKELYAADLDLVLASKAPPGPIAFLDYKSPTDEVTFAEVLIYEKCKVIAPVVIVTGLHPTLGPFKVWQYVHGDFRPFPPDVWGRHVLDCANYEQLIAWERRLRQSHQRLGRPEFTLYLPQAELVNLNKMG